MVCHGMNSVEEGWGTNKKHVNKQDKKITNCDPAKQIRNVR